MSSDDEGPSPVTSVVEVPTSSHVGVSGSSRTSIMSGGNQEQSPPEIPPMPTKVNVSVSSELYRVALHVARVAPNLQMEIPSHAVMPNNQPNQTSTSAGGQSNLTVEQTLVRLLDLIRNQDSQLAKSQLTQPSRLLGYLGFEVLLSVFSYLEATTDLVALRSVCSGFRQIILRSEYLWQNITESHLPVWYARHMASTRTKNVPTRPGVAKWCSIFEEKVMNDRRWMLTETAGLKTEPDMLKLPRGLHCVCFDDRELFCGSGGNNEVLVFDLLRKRGRGTSVVVDNSPQLEEAGLGVDAFAGNGGGDSLDPTTATSSSGGVVALAGQQQAVRPNEHHGRGLNGQPLPYSTLVGHEQAVSCMQPVEHDSNLFITASLDHTMRLWDRSLKQPRLKFEGHTDKVWCLQVSGSRVFSGGSDKTIKIWDIETTKTLATLKDHRTSISTLKLMKNSNGATLVTGSAGNTIRVWNITQSAAICTNKLRGHEKGVFCLDLTHSRLLSGSLDNTVKLWDPRCTYQFLHSMVDPPAPLPPNASRNQRIEDRTGIITFCCDDYKMVTGGPEQVIKLWDLRMFRLVSRLSGHQHWVTSVQFDDNKIVSASRDRTVRFWNMTGKMGEDENLPFGEITQV